MIPFLDLKAQYRALKDEINPAVLRVLESGQYVLGPEVTAFEEAFAASCGTRFAVGVNSGTSALHLALLAAGVKQGDEVLTTPFTFVATVAAILYAGARPVFADVHPQTLNLDPEKAAGRVTPKTKVLLPVHLYGQPAHMDPLLALAKKKNLTVIEDAAQAHGAEYKGRRAGNLGDMGCFSFYPGKNLGAYGEGGLITTNNPEWARLLRLYRDWGAEKKYHHDLPGYNYRMEAIQGAVLGAKLRHLDSWTKARRERADFYDHRLGEKGVGLPQILPGAEPARHIYAIFSGQRDALRGRLEERGIQTHIHYPIPVHLQKAYASLGYRKGDFPIAESLADRVLSLPLYPELSMEDAAQVADEVLRAMR